MLQAVLTHQHMQAHLSHHHLSLVCVVTMQWVKIALQIISN